MTSIKTEGFILWIKYLWLKIVMKKKVVAFGEQNSK